MRSRGSASVPNRRDDQRVPCDARARHGRVPRCDAPEATRQLAGLGRQHAGDEQPAGDYAGKIELIYIDPPFDTGADFTYRVSVGD